MRQMETKTWCVEWFGSEGDFLAGGKRQPIPLAHLSGLENLYAIGALEQRPGEVSVFDSVPFVSEVWNPTETIDSNRVYRAEFLIYTIVERWHRASIWKSVNSEEELEAVLLPRAVVEGIPVDEPFPFLLYGYAARAAGRFFCDPDHQHGQELSEKAKSRFSIEKESIEIIGFYSVNHRGILTPRDSPFHMHLRTMDNRISGHLESVQWDQGFMAELPAKERVNEVSNNR
jgi:acetolactate decarboxylase